MPDRKYFIAFILCGVGLVLLSLLALSLGRENAEALKAEGGIIEIASVAGYFITAAWLFYRGGLEFALKHSYFVILIVLFGLREMDLDKAFTTMGIFKSRFYTSPEVPIWEKAVGGVFILLLLWILYSLVRRHLLQLLRGLRKLSVVSIGAVLTIGLLVFAKGIDGLPRKLESIGVERTEAITYRFGVIEEVFELGIPILIFLTFHAWFTHQRVKSGEGKKAA